MTRFAALFALVLLAPLAQAPDFTALVRDVASAVVNLSGSLDYPGGWPAFNPDQAARAVGARIAP